MSDKDALQQVENAPWKSPLAHGVVGGLIGLIPFGRLRGWGQGLFIGLPSAAVGAAAALWAASTPPDQRTRNAVLSVAAVGLMAGGQWVTIAVDRKLESGLRRRRVPAPRLVIAVLSAAASYGSAVLDRRTPQGRESQTTSGGQPS